MKKLGKVFGAMTFAVLAGVVAVGLSACGAVGSTLRTQTNENWTVSSIAPRRVDTMGNSNMVAIRLSIHNGRDGNRTFTTAPFTVTTTPHMEIDARDFGFSASRFNPTQETLLHFAPDQTSNVYFHFRFNPNAVSPTQVATRIIEVRWHGGIIYRHVPF